MDRQLHIKDSANLADAGNLIKTFYKIHPEILVLTILLAFIGILVGIHLNPIYGVVINFIDLTLFFLLPHWIEKTNENSIFKE